jgi:hypothetical protein
MCQTDNTRNAPYQDRNSDDFRIVADVTEWKKQLITKEDPFYIHKTLGILCLCSFIWRYMHIGASSDMGFITHPQYTIPTLALHFMLTASSFEFKIPNRRIKDGTRIWPEYRMHAMVFLCRSLAVIARYWYEQEFNVPRNYDFNIAVVILAMVGADLCSASVGKEYRSNSVRDVDTHPALKYFFSVIQFFATAGYLIGFPFYTFPFLAIIVVQLTPFLATLRRKNLIGRVAGALAYALLLVSGYVISVYYSPGSLTLIRITGCFSLVAATWRLMPLPSWARPIQNKYLIWGTLGLAMRYLRPYFTTWSYDQILTVFRCELAMIALLGYYKINYGYNNSPGKRQTEAPRNKAM